MAEENKAIIRRFLEAFAENDQETLRELFAPEHTFHHASGPVNRERHLQGINMLGAAFSNIQGTIHDQIAEGDMVATRLTWQATHSGDFQGNPPTHKEIKVSGISIDRIKGGRISERWFVQDELGMMQQLDLIPPP